MVAVGYKEKVVVIGAGISGLACAYHLKQLGIHCLVLEAKERAV
jgi:flavin-dependent dehydrogenase